MSLVELVLHKLQETGERAPEIEHWCNGAAQPRLAIDLATLRAAGLVPADEDERRLMEQYRHIKRPLIANVNANGRGATSLLNRHLIVIASAMPGEGKTFTAINLALSMAMEKDVQVVLVDAD